MRDHLDTTGAVPRPPRHLNVFDATMLVMGGIIGVGIFVNPSVVANIVRAPAANLAAWAIGGLIALAGAFVYAELAARLPAPGGQYAYLREAYHPAVAFMFGWATLLVIETGGLAAVSIAFARYFRVIAPLPVPDMAVAVGTLALIAAINCSGIKTAKVTQDTFTVLKISAVSFVVGCGVVALVRYDPATSTAAAMSVAPGGEGSWSLFGGLAAALTPVMFTYGGWQTASFVSAELRHPQRDLSRAMIYGMVGVVALYLSVVAVYLFVLGPSDLAATKTPAKAIVDRITGGAGGIVLSTFVCVATFGSLMQGLFTVPRLYQAMARDGLFFRRAAYISPRAHVPTVAILVHAAMGALIALAGTYEAITSYVVSIDFVFLGLAAIALLILRRRGVGEAGTYRAPGGVWTAGFFLLACIGIVAATAAHAPSQSLIGFAALTLGIPAYGVWRKLTNDGGTGSAGGGNTGPTPSRRERQEMPTLRMLGLAIAANLAIGIGAAPAAAAQTEAATEPAAESAMASAPAALATPLTVATPAYPIELGGGDTARAEPPHAIRWYHGVAALAGVSALMLLDEPTQRFMQDHRSSTSNHVATAFRQFGQPDVFLPAAFGLAGIGVVTHHPALIRAGGRLFAALGLAGSSALVLKKAIGRDRPIGEHGAFDFVPFGHQDAMPSGHTTMAFAMATALADDLHNRWSSVGLYAIATGTAWSRLNDDKHWLSDTGFGAIIGITAAKLVDERWQVFGLKPPSVLVGPGGAAHISWHAAF